MNSTNVFFLSFLLSTSLFASTKKVCEFLKQNSVKSSVTFMIENNHLVKNDLNGIPPDSLVANCDEGFEELFLDSTKAKGSNPSSIGQITKGSGMFIFPLCANNTCPIVAMVEEYKGALNIGSVGQAGRAKIITESKSRINRLREKLGSEPQIKRVSTPDDRLDLLLVTDSSNGEEFMVIASPEVEKSISEKNTDEPELMYLSDVLSMLEDINDANLANEELLEEFDETSTVTVDDSQESDLPPEFLPAKKPTTPKISPDGKTVNIAFEPVVEPVKVESLALEKSEPVQVRSSDAIVDEDDKASNSYSPYLLGFIFLSLISIVSWYFIVKRTS